MAAIVAVISNLATAVSHTARKPSEGKKKSNSRWNKSKKRKIEDVEMDDADGIAVEEDVMKASKKNKENKGEAMVKKSRKAGKEGNKSEKSFSEGSKETGEKPPKKRRKTNENENEDAAQLKEEARGEEGSSKKARFIVFIGNLPYNATTKALQKHFAPVKPDSVRLITHKEDPKKCKGFAFLEFDKFDKMKTCLAKFHHSTFYAEGDKPEEGGEGKGGDDGKWGRKINVELTAGGGGISKARREKLSVKNEKLNEERKRKVQEEEKLKVEKRAKNVEGNGNEGIHPSRLARMEGDCDGAGIDEGRGDGYESEQGERGRGGGRSRGYGCGSGDRRGGRGGRRGMWKKRQEG
ncbi:hypothetical protein EV426DRAFT_614206 [Tirmania nivea]|nr:hypothetical protein EV426DRAFT_614206 [Tirmania nivea]